MNSEAQVMDHVLTADQESCTYTYREVWDRLSQVDVADHIQKKNNLSYLSWAWAWQVMMEEFPETQYFFHPTETHPDGTATVHCTVAIGNLHRDMWLPCMTGFKNAATESPGARDIGDAKMRCLVKAFAMFGLGHYIYAGEDLPQSNERTRVAKGKGKDPVVLTGAILPDPLPISDEEKDMNRAIDETMSVFLEDVKTIDELKKFWGGNSAALKKLENSDKPKFDELLNKFKVKKAEIVSAGENVSKKDGE